MAADAAGELLVLIRPDTAGFTQAAEGPIAEAGKTLSKVFLAAFAVGGIAETIKGVVEAATEHQSAFAVLDQTVKNAGAANEVYGQTIESLLEKEARLKGFSDEDLASGFVRLVSVTKDSQKAFTDLGLAEDVARARHIGLANAALALSKAEQGSATALQRLGIIVPAVTKNVDALKTAHEQAIVSGAKFTASQTDAYKAALLVAAGEDKVATRTADLAAIQDRFGGSAGTFADTAAGQFARLQQDFHQFEVTIGEDIVPSLATAAEALGSFFTALTENQGVQQGFESFAHELVTGFGDLKQVAETVGPPLLVVAKAATEVVQAVGAKPLIAAVVTFKALGIAATAAAAAESFYARAVAAGTVAQTASVAATEAQVSANAADTAGTSVLALRIQAATAANGELAASYAAAAEAATVAAAAEEGAFARGAGALALGAVGGPLGVAVIAVTALAGGIAYLATRTSAWDSANQAATSNLSNLTSEIGAAQAATEALSAAQDKQEKNPTGGGAADLIAAQNAADASAAAVEAGFQKTADSISDLASSTTTNAAVMADWGKTVDGVTASQEKLSVESGKDASGVKVFTDALAQQSVKLGDSNPLLEHNIGLLEQLTAELGRIPTKVDIQLLINNQSPTAALQDVLQGISAFSLATDAVAGASKAASAAGAKAVLAPIFDPLNSALSAAGDAAKVLAQKKATDAGAAAAKAAADALRDGITSDQTDLSQLATQMADAVTQGVVAVDQAVESAKQNFTQIGQSLGASIGTFLTKPLTDAATQLGTESDRIALQFDTVNAKLTAQASILNLASERLAQQSAARQAQFAGENALLTQEQNRIGLRSDQQNLANLRREIVLPGGRSLSDDTKTALAQLNELEKKTKDPALQAFITQFQTAGIKVSQDKIGIATTPNPKEAQRAADLGVASGQVSLAQAGLAARKQLTDTAIQLKRDHLQVLQDAAALETQTATTMLANLTDLFDKGQLKFAVFSKDVAVILKGAGLTPAAANKVLGVAGADTIAGQITGLGKQAAAITGGPQRAGSGLAPTIVNPLTTVNQVAKQIAGIAQQQRDKQHELTKATNQLIVKQTAALKAAQFTNSLQKNQTNKSKLQQDLAGVAG